MKTTIYLDVDGVLNAVQKRNPSTSATGWSAWETKQVNGWAIHFSPELIEELNELAEHPDVTFKWLTTWTHDAAKVLSPAIGINGQEWAVLDGDQHGWRGADWWKLQAIQKDVFESMPDQFIWVDDDISAERVAIEWVAGRDNGYAISPFTVEALTRTHVEEIKVLAGLMDDAA